MSQMTLSPLNVCTTLPPALPTNARKHYLDVNCASNYRKHLIVSIPTASALSDYELSSYISVVKNVFWQRDWTITWVAGSSVTIGSEKVYQLAVKNTNAHKSTVKKRLMAALSLRRQELHLDERKHSSEKPIPVESLLPIMVKCRNGEGPLAQHLFPSTADTDVNGVVVEGIQSDKLRTMAQIVRQHRKTRGGAKKIQQPRKRQKILKEKPKASILVPQLPEHLEALEFPDPNYLRLDFDDIFAGNNTQAAIIRENLTGTIVSYTGSPLNSPLVLTSIIKSDMADMWVL